MGAVICSPSFLDSCRESAPKPVKKGAELEPLILADESGAPRNKVMLVAPALLHSDDPRCNSYVSSVLFVHTCCIFHLMGVGNPHAIRTLTALQRHLRGEFLAQVHVLTRLTHSDQSDDVLDLFAMR